MINIETYIKTLPKAEKMKNFLQVFKQNLALKFMNFAEKIFDILNRQIKEYFIYSRNTPTKLKSLIFK